MDNHGFADDLGHAEATGQHHAERISAGFQQRRQIARVLRMLAASGVVMPHRVRKGVGHIARAAVSLVDMEAEYVPGTGCVRVRQPFEQRLYQYAARRLEEFYGAADIGIRCAAVYVRDGLWPAAASR